MADTLPPVFLATAIEAVIKAGAMQLAGADNLHVEKKGAIDLVTQIDRDVERMFRAIVAERFPGHVVLGEEFEEAGQREQIPEYCWVFDPVDGTTNYAHGLPIFCSALALEVRGRAYVAAVYDPNRRELFTAERGQGAWLNGQPLRVSSASALIDSLLVTGFPYSVQHDPAELVGLFGEFLTKVRAVRRLGSAALDLCYVAAGRFDGFWEMSLNPWDMASGALIVEEAGGRASTFDGGPPEPGGSFVSTNSHLHDEVVSLLRS
jgi:myo-inositol-1(or 4)-monophosphatase